MRLHEVLRTPIDGPVPDGHEVAYVAMGCFWGAESQFWPLPGVYTTAAGFTGGNHPAPTDDLVVSGVTGHAEAVRIVFDPATIGYAQLLRTFWENHDPTQGNRQGNDIGTHCRSGLFATTDTQLAVALASRDAYQPVLISHGYGPITTEIAPAGSFHVADAKHQQFLAKHRGGYCAQRRQSYAGTLTTEQLTARA